MEDANTSDFSALVTKWREQAKKLKHEPDYDGGYGDALDTCADELERKIQERIAAAAAPARTTPGGNKINPLCSVLACTTRASFIINDRPYCFAHRDRSGTGLPPSLRNKY